jgi:3-oxoadipate enol-lactonase
MEPIMSASHKRNRIKTRTGSIAVFESGSGTPLVFWPSLFSDHRLYSQVVRILGSDWRTLCIDGPGFGQSDPPQGEIPAQIYADAIIDILNALEIEKAFIAGCSWGGQIAAHVGAKAPERVHGVLIMNSPLGPSMGGHLFEVFGTRWFGSTQFWGNGVARSFFSKSLRENHPERVREFVSAFSSFDRIAAATTARTVLARFPGLSSVLPELKVPTTILMGEEDRLYPVEKMRPFARLAPMAKIEIIPKCGHLAPLEAPEVVVTALHELRTQALGN